jgi:pilus assembly protein TadC
MDFVHLIYRKYPKLKRQLIMAHLKISPFIFIKQTLLNSTLAAIGLTFIALIFMNQINANQRWDVPGFAIVSLGIFVAFPLLWLFLFSLLINTPVSAIRHRRNDIEKEVLFAGRYLLIKLNSGQPLLNALIDASRSYGVASKYFKEIVDDINLGLPLEDALKQAMNLSPSPAFKKILFQISNALLIGVDVSTSLQGVIDDVTAEQITQIDAYSHKLNSVALFYMLTAIVAPSLGLTIFIVIAGMIGFPVTTLLYFILWGAVVLTQLFFIVVFKSIRPNINF